MLALACCRARTMRLGARGIAQPLASTDCGRAQQSATSCRVMAKLHGAQLQKIIQKTIEAVAVPLLDLLGADLQDICINIFPEHCQVLVRLQRGGLF